MGERVLRGVVRGALAACLLAAAAPGRAAMPEDLQLDRAPEVLVRTDPAPNPHATLPCERCHTKGESSYAVARRFGLHLPLVTEAEGGAVLLCEQCHKDYHVFHPVNFPVKRLAEAVTRAAVFPLETPVEGYNKVTCTTCHDVHFPHTAQKLLRGFPVDDQVGGAPFRSRLEFCRACHGAEELLELSAHRSTAGDGGCGLCHGARDIAGAIGPLKRGLNLTCALCHPQASGAPAHFYSYNPFPGMTREAMAGYGVTLPEGRFACSTCHRHHRPNQEAPFLTAPFLAAAARSSRINPHQTTRFCLNCHPVNPPPPGTPGALAPLVVEDVTHLCRGCHSRPGDLQMHHPLVPPSGKAPVPPEWPRGKGDALGCQTCHLAGHGARNPANPKFLRGGPYAQRNEVCFRCHREEEVRDRDIHAEVAAGSGCAFCHEVTDRTSLHPEGKAGPLLAEPSLLCLPCHAVPPHPASSDHTVRPRTTEFLMIDEKKAPLFEGKITCHTCHDSHGTAAGNQLLRTIGRTPICSTCHPF